MRVVPRQVFPSSVGALDLRHEQSIFSCWLASRFTQLVTHVMTVSGYVTCDPFSPTAHDMLKLSCQITLAPVNRGGRSPPLFLPRYCASSDVLFFRGKVPSRQAGPLLVETRVIGRQRRGCAFRRQFLRVSNPIDENLLVCALTVWRSISLLPAHPADVCRSLSPATVSGK